MGIRSVVARLRPQPRANPDRRPPEAFAIMHSADLDIHIGGVVRPPTACPPWPAPSRSRFEAAVRREPSVMARVLLDVHPAFAGAGSATDVERAEVLAVEWAVLTPSAAARWLSAHPTISAQQALRLAEAGWHPRDPRVVVPDRVIDLGTGVVREQRRAG